MTGYSLGMPQQPDETVPSVEAGGAKSNNAAQQLPTIEAIQRRRAEIEESTVLDEAAKKELLKSLDDIGKQIDETNRTARHLAALKKRAKDAPEAIATAKKAVQKEKKSPQRDSDFSGTTDQLQGGKDCCRSSGCRREAVCAKNWKRNVAVEKND